MQVVFIVRALPPLLPPPRCECCGKTEGVALESSRTQYVRDMTPWERRTSMKLYAARCAAWRLGDPAVPREPNRWDYESHPRHDEVENRSLSLCRSCAEDHHAEWDERWAEYYSGLL